MPPPPSPLPFIDAFSWEVEGVSAPFSFPRVLR
jgi:hypothetical protein